METLLRGEKILKQTIDITIDILYLCLFSQSKLAKVVILRLVVRVTRMLLLGLLLLIVVMVVVMLMMLHLGLDEAAGGAARVVVELRLRLVAGQVLEQLVLL